MDANDEVGKPPIPAAAVPDIEIFPGDAIKFDLSRPKAAPVILKLKHNGDQSGKNDPVLYKIKTTVPKRYLVRPNQGLLAPKSEVQIEILLTERDLKTFREDPLQREEALTSDKFLIQTTSINEAIMEGWSEKSVEEKAKQVVDVWQNTEKKNITGKRMKIQFIEDSAQSPSRSGPETIGGSFRDSRQDKIKAAQAGSIYSLASDTNPEGFVTDIAGLRKKYDDLVAFTVNLTAERDMLNNELSETKRELQREMVQRMSLESKKGDGLRQRKKNSPDNEDSGADQGTLSGKKISQGFSLFVLLLVAFLSFLLGKYFSRK